MSNKEEPIKLTGEILEVLPNTTFKVKIPNGKIILAHVSGKMRQNKIRLTLSDTVEMEVSPYDLSKGRITRRL